MIRRMAVRETIFKWIICIFRSGLDLLHNVLHFVEYVNNTFAFIIILFTVQLYGNGLILKDNYYINKLSNILVLTIEQ